MLIFFIFSSYSSNDYNKQELSTLSDVSDMCVCVRVCVKYTECRNWPQENLYACTDSVFCCFQTKTAEVNGSGLKPILNQEFIKNTNGHLPQVSSVSLKRVCHSHVTGNKNLKQSSWLVLMFALRLQHFYHCCLGWDWNPKCKAGEDEKRLPVSHQKGSHDL